MEQAAKALPEPELELTPEVRQELAKLTSRGNTFVEQALDRREQYYPVMEQIFRDEGVPVVLLNVALIESGFSTSARSPSGAVGMWQFMKGTAQTYGLRISHKEDQRRDPILSTIAAARHLRDLYLIYKDWYLALAAYNAGPGAIDRAITKSGHTDFWALARTAKAKLCSQTKQYVPKFIAAALMVRERENLLSSVARNNRECEPNCDQG